MKAKKIFTFSLVTLFLFAFVAVGLAQEMSEKGQLIIHPEKKDVKVLFKNWKHKTIMYDDDTEFSVSGKEGSSKDLSAHGDNWPTGTVTYIMKDGKPVAKEISFPKVKKKKKKK